MDFRFVSGSLLESKTDLIVFCAYADAARDPVFRAASAMVHGTLDQLAKEQGFEGKEGQILTLRTAGTLAATNLVVLGLGDRASFRIASARDHAARICALAQQLGAKSLVYAVPETAGEQRSMVVQLTVEGAILGTYRFDKYRTADKRPLSLRRFGLMTEPQGKAGSASQTRAARAAIERGRSVAEAVCQARDMINEPACYMTPAQLASDARALAKRAGLKIKVLGRSECERLGMGMFLSVAKGSEHEPKLIHMTYTPKGKPKSRIALVGKGVMFDSGGYSLKPHGAMEDMKIDMSGAALVISAMGAIASLGSQHEVHAIAACCENMVSGGAFKPGDVLHAMDGTTIEINNTDAEGRLTLGDSLVYARTKVKADEIFDFATLTGACMIALGPFTAAVLSDSEDTVSRWLAAAARVGEDMWRLPLNKRLKDQLKSHVADMRNTGERYGGTITAGLFLQHFVKDTKWVHVDIAGPAFSNADRGAVPRGGTGFGVASVIEYVTGR